MDRVLRSWLVAALLLVGPSPALGQSDLDVWVEEDLLPILEARLGRHPRLRDTPFQVVILDQGGITARPSALAWRLRDRIIQGLQGSPGIRLVDPLPQQLRLGARDLDAASCTPTVAAAQLTVEVDRWRPQGQYRLAVRALDLREQAWIQGIYQVWTGPLTPAEQRQFREQVVDPRQLGSRQAPFRRAQLDLLAASLADDIACRLRDVGARAARVRLHLPDALPQEVRGALGDLLSDYLAAFRGLELVASAAEADQQIRLRARALEGGRYRLRAELASIDASALVRPGRSAYLEVEAPASTPAAAGQPAAQPEPADEPRAQTPFGQRPGRLIERFSLVAPFDQSACSGAEPWDGGILTLREGSRLASGGCFAAIYRTGGAGTLYLFMHSADGRLTRLLPNNCGALHLREDPRRLPAATELHMPLFRDGRPGLFRLDEQTGRETLYAVAVADRAAGRVLERRLAPVRNICRLDNPVRRRAAEEIVAVLEQLRRQAEGQLEWQSRSLRHVSRR